MTATNYPPKDGTAIMPTDRYSNKHNTQYSSKIRYDCKDGEVDQKRNNKPRRLGGLNSRCLAMAIRCDVPY